MTISSPINPQEVTEHHTFTRVVKAGDGALLAEFETGEKHLLDRSVLLLGPQEIIQHIEATKDERELETGSYPIEAGGGVWSRWRPSRRYEQLIAAQDAQIDIQNRKKPTTGKVAHEEKENREFVFCAGVLGFGLAWVACFVTDPRSFNEKPDLGIKFIDQVDVPSFKTDASVVERAKISHDQGFLSDQAIREALSKAVKAFEVGKEPTIKLVIPLPEPVREDIQRKYPHRCFGHYC